MSRDVIGGAPARNGAGESRQAAAATIFHENANGEARATGL